MARDALGAPAALALAALLLLPAAGGDAPGSLVERNRAALLASLPEGAVLEVRVVRDGEVASETWTGEAYAAFRADFAARMGRDYAAPAPSGPEGLPGGTGDYLFFCDNWIDAWGTTRVNVDAPVRSPRSIFWGDKMCWIYSGPGARTFIHENENQCLPLGGGRVCSSTYGWFFPQGGSEHGDSWWAGTGLSWIFPPPFGSVTYLTGLAVAEAL